ncbi:hypothetical protein NG798_24115 [Ancylothrix sp. C2]|uniref:hypothetical protein n=1 Tax=Ancylothrix sp. D3o TaxID=2953691 RepID=UPI0021BA424F|nr:hypothetical protein [Ancylothrix sp. D3o]MCT7952889.1 hypothetical protein [Ancylothrix sp. D3o]
MLKHTVQSFKLIITGKIEDIAEAQRREIERINKELAESLKSLKIAWKSLGLKEGKDFEISTEQHSIWYFKGKEQCLTHPSAGESWQRYMTILGQSDKFYGHKCAHNNPNYIKGYKSQKIRYRRKLMKHLSK